MNLVDIRDEHYCGLLPCKTCFLLEEIDSLTAQLSHANQLREVVAKNLAHCEHNQERERASFAKTILENKVKNEQLRSRVSELREALEFYSDKLKYENFNSEPAINLHRDSGEIAREALEAAK
jgi:hypothetical protein